PPHRRALDRHAAGGRPRVDRARGAPAAAARRTDGRHRPARGRSVRPAAAAAPRGRGLHDRARRTRRAARRRAVLDRRRDGSGPRGRVRDARRGEPRPARARRVPRRERGRPPRVGPDAGERADDDRIWDGSGRRPRPWGALVTGMTGLARPARDLAARWNPVRVTRRAARRFARRPRAMQLRTIAIVVATIAGLVVYVARAPEPPASPQPF